MAASNSSTGVQLQTTVKKSAVQIQPVKESTQSYFLTRIKTSVGETSQLCRKIECMKNGQLVHAFQPLTQNEISQIFQHQITIKNIKTPNLGPMTLTAATPVMSSSPVIAVKQVQPPKPGTTANTWQTNTHTITMTPSQVANSKPASGVLTGAQSLTQVLSPAVVTKPGGLPTGVFVPAPVLSGVTITSTKPGVSQPASVVLTGVPSAVKPVLSQNQKPNLVMKISGEIIHNPQGGKDATAATNKRTVLDNTNIIGALGTTKQNLLKGKTIILQKLPGQNNYVVETIVGKPGLSSSNTWAGKKISLGGGLSSAGGVKIPVGKVIPQQQVKSQSAAAETTSTATNVGQLGLNSVFKTAPLVTAKLNSVNAASRLKVFSALASGSHDVEKSGEKADVLANSQIDKAGRETPLVASEVMEESPMDIDGDSLTCDTRTANQTPNEPCLIPMKITAVSETGDDISVSREIRIPRDNIEHSVIDDASSMVRDTDNSKNRVGVSGVTDHCGGDVVNRFSCDAEKSRETGNTGRDIVRRGSRDTENSGVENASDKSTSDTSDSTSAKHNEDAMDVNPKASLDSEMAGITPLQNIYARVYLAPPSPGESSQDDSTDAKRDAENISLKIGSVFSLNDDQKKEFFPEPNNNDTSSTSAQRESTDGASFDVRIKQEPLDEGDNDEASQHEFDNTGVKEEPDSPYRESPQVKIEPTDDYDYSNFSIPNEGEDSSDDDDDDSESTDTATEDSPVKIKKEPEDDDTKNTTEPDISTTPPLPSSSDAKTPVSATPPTSTPNSTATSSSTLVGKTVCGSTVIGKTVSGSTVNKLTGQFKSIGANSVVTDIHGKKYLVVSPPEKAMMKLKGQDGVIGSKVASTGRSYLVTMSNGQKRLVHLPLGAPASTLLTTLAKGNTVNMKTALASATASKQPAKLPTQRGAQTVGGSSSGKQTAVVTEPGPPHLKMNPPYKITVVKPPCQVVKSQKSSEPKITFVATTESNSFDESRRRSSRERRNKRRYSPPPIGPVRKQKYTCVSPPVLEKEWDNSRTAESSDTEHSSENESDHNQGGAAKKMDDEPAPLTPAVASREERMRLLKDLIREKEAALEEMRKKREKEKEERENDPDLMDL